MLFLLISPMMRFYEAKFKTNAKDIHLACGLKFHDALTRSYDRLSNAFLTAIERMEKVIKSKHLYI